MPPPSGVVPKVVAEAFEKGLFDVPARPEGLGVSAAPAATWHIPVVLAAFADAPLAYSSAEFDSALFGTRGAMPTGSVREYYRWVSGGRLDITGRVVATVTLPGTRAYYGDGYWGLSGRQRNSVFGAVKDALQRCTDDVDWSAFDVNPPFGTVDMLWFVHAGKDGQTSPEDSLLRRPLWSITSKLSSDPGYPLPTAFQTNQPVAGSPNQFYKLDRFACLPELSGIIPGRRAEIGVYCHEFGHALGLPDLYDTSSLGSIANVGPGNWSLMSTGGYGGSGLTPETPSHLGGWAATYLGWNEILRPSRDTTIVLPPISSGGPVVEFWFQGESNPEHFLLETRAKEGFDAQLRRAGMIVTHVDDALMAQRGLPNNNVNVGPNPGLVLVEADGDFDLIQGRNRGDPFDVFPGDSQRTRIDDQSRPHTRSFKNAVTNISIENIALVGNQVRMDLRVQPPGWFPAEDHTDPLFQPLSQATSGNLAVVGAGGSADAVSCEFRAGRPQVVLHRRDGASWLPGVVLSASPNAALSPAITTLPGGNAAVAWSDTRGGRSVIMARVRLDGQWGPECVVGETPGQNSAPAIGADGRGRVYVAWRNLLDDVPRVYFTRFVYFAPFGQALPVTAITSPPRMPGNPAVAVDEDGISYILWPDAADNPHTKLWFARFNPDSGLADPAPLTATAGSEGSMSGVVDPDGTLHLVWQVSGTMSEIHYQRRYKATRPAPRDTVLVSSGGALRNPNLAIDPSGAMHLVYEATVGGASQVFYKRWRPVWGWDLVATEISSALDGTAGAPLVLPETPGNVSVLFTGYGAAGPRFMVRRRELDLPTVPPTETRAEAAPVVVTLAPNPLRAGQEFEIVWAGAPPAPGARAELFDIAGRRVAAADLVRDGAGWRARFTAVVTSRLPSGVYFARARAAEARALRLVVLR